MSDLPERSPGPPEYPPEPCECCEASPCECREVDNQMELSWFRETAVAIARTQASF
jgi:hypothetical protein